MGELREVTRSSHRRWLRVCTVDESSSGFRSDRLKVRGKGLMRKWSGKYTEIARVSLVIYSVRVQFTREKGEIFFIKRLSGYQSGSGHEMMFWLKLLVQSVIYATARRLLRWPNDFY